MSLGSASARAGHAPVPDETSERPAASERIVSIRGLRLFVRECGEGDPLLLINGLGANVQMWGPSQQRLSTIARTIAFDAPGMGRSRTSPVVLPHPAYAALICRLLDALAIERCDVIGYSFGGTVAQQLARQAPGRVRRMALVGTSCGWGSVPPTGRALALIATPLRYYSRVVLEQTSWLLDGVSRDREAETMLAQADARLQYPPTLTGYAQQFIAGATWSSLHWVSTLRTPTLVLAGERDLLVPPANGALLSHRLTQSRLHVLAGEGHLMLFDRLSASHELLTDFFSSNALEDSRTWQTGEVVDDERLEQALRDAEGIQPVKAASAAYRWWTGRRAVRHLAEDLHLVHRR